MGWVPSANIMKQENGRVLLTQQPYYCTWRLTEIFMLQDVKVKELKMGRTGIGSPGSLVCCMPLVQTVTRGSVGSVVHTLPSLEYLAADYLRAVLMANPLQLVLHLQAPR